MDELILMEISDLCKTINNHKILDSVSLTLPSNRIVGILGPNGSGKTSLFNILAGLEKSFSGKVTIKGQKIGYATRKIVAYCPSIMMFDNNLQVDELCTMFAHHYKDFNLHKFNEMLSEIAVDARCELRRLTTSMLQQIQLILVLARDVDVYLLDEPIRDVDLLKRKQLVNLIKKYKKDGSLVLMTSHHIEDFSTIYDDVIILKQGQVIKYGSMEDICVNQNKTLVDIFVEEFK